MTPKRPSRFAKPSGTAVDAVISLISQTFYIPEIRLVLSNVFGSSHPVCSTLNRKVLPRIPTVFVCFLPAHFQYPYEEKQLTTAIQDAGTDILFHFWHHYDASVLLYTLMNGPGYGGVSIPYPVIFAARDIATYGHAVPRNRHLHSEYCLSEAVLVCEFIHDPQTVLQLFFWLRIQVSRF